jgi:large subunit ribosomal protein L21
LFDKTRHASYNHFSPAARQVRPLLFVSITEQPIFYKNGLFQTTGGVIVYAVFQVGGQQFRASVGDRICVELLPQPVGDAVELDQVLLVSDGKQVQVGRPTVQGAKVKATIVEQSQGDKITVFHYRPGGKRHKVKTGHRQDYTWLRVDDIVAG